MKKIILTILMVVIFCNIAYSWSGNVNTTLMSYTTFDNSYNDTYNITYYKVNDSYGSGYLKETTTCKIGNCSNMTIGTSRAFLKNITISKNKNWSISYWYMRRSTSMYHIPFKVGGNTQGLNNNVHHLIYNGATDYFRVTTTGGQFDKTAANTISTWYHVVIIHTLPDSYEFYRNGASLGTTTQSMSTDYNNTGYVTIGEDNDLNAFAMEGYLDELGFWNATLTSNDVAYLYNSGNANRPNYTEPEPAPPSNPPVISNFCDQSDGTCTSPFNGTDDTPTVNFSTDVNADCKISKTNVSYASMTNVCSYGNGTTTHRCTLATSFNNKYINKLYVGCNNTATGVYNNDSTVYGFTFNVTLNPTRSYGQNITRMKFSPNFTYLNTTTGKLLQYNISVYNQTSTNYFYRLCNNGFYPANLSVILNSSNSNIKIKCATNNQSSNSNYINTSVLYLNDSLDASQCNNIWCWADYINATGSYSFKSTWTVE